MSQEAGIEWPAVRDVAAELNRLRQRGIHRIDSRHFNQGPVALPNLERLLEIGGRVDPDERRQDAMRALLSDATESSACSRPAVTRVLFGLIDDSYGMEERAEVEAMAFGSATSGHNRRSRQSQIATMRDELAQAALALCDGVVKRRSLLTASQVDTILESATALDDLRAELERLRDCGDVSAVAIANENCRVLMSLDVTESERRRLRLGHQDLPVAAASAIKCVLDHSPIKTERRRLLRTLLGLEAGSENLYVRRLKARPQSVLVDAFQDFENQCFSHFAKLLTETRETPCLAYANLPADAIDTYVQVRDRLERLPYEDDVAVRALLYRGILAFSPLLDEMAFDELEGPNQISDEQAWNAAVRDYILPSIEPWIVDVAAVSYQRNLLASPNAVPYHDGVMELLTLPADECTTHPSEKGATVVFIAAALLIADMHSEWCRPTKKGPAVRRKDLLSWLGMA